MSPMAVTLMQKPFERRKLGIDQISDCSVAKPIEPACPARRVAL